MEEHHREWERRFVDLEQRLTEDATEEQAKCPARYLGNRQIQIGNEPPFYISLADAEVLQAALEIGGVFTGREIDDRSGVPDATRHLRSLAKDERLSPFIRLSGSEQDGYFVSIIDGRN